MPSLLTDAHLPDYLTQLRPDVAALVGELRRRAAFTAEDFTHYVTVSSVFSSRIEGNSLDLNSFLRGKANVSAARQKEFAEIEALAAAYQYAVAEPLTLKTFLHAHAILSKPLLRAASRGKVRQGRMAVYDSASGRPVYIAVEPEYVAAELHKLLADTTELLRHPLPTAQALYYASLIHLWVAMIHPFDDGNGRAARLLEKWFLARTLGDVAWAITSERHYWLNRPAYYERIQLGVHYYVLRWEQCVPFLLMLPAAVEESAALPSLG